jgi:hypothetical protein
MEAYLRQLPYSHEGTMNEEWEKCKGALIPVAHEVLEKTIREARKIWFDDDCQRVAAEKNTASKSIKNVTLGLQWRLATEEKD